jgi:hypothetical protein
MSMALFQGLSQEIEALEVENYHQLTLTVIVENIQTGSPLNCGYRIEAKSTDPNNSPIIISFDSVGEIIEERIHN